MIKIAKFNEFMNALTIPQQIFIIAVVLIVLWFVFSPYYALWHLKDIDRELFKIGKELKELKEVIKNYDRNDK